MSNSEFMLNPYPSRFEAKYMSEKNLWDERYITLPNKGKNESSLSDDELQELLASRNEGGHFPLINYTTQYAFGCFEGLKAYPYADGGLVLFRPEANAQRFCNSMEGMYMPAFPVERFVPACKQVVSESAKLGFSLAFEKSWVDNLFATARSIYIRPFTYSEPGIGVMTIKEPWVIIMATEVGNYLDIVDCPTLGISKRSRATANGTGWIKCAANYVTSALAKHEALDAGFHEALFLDAVERKYIEECSSCNVFFVLQDDTIITPELSDTILPGITRDSVITLAKTAGYTVEERKVSLDEIRSNAKECFVTGTAVGVGFFGQISYEGTLTTFGNGRIGEVTKKLQVSLKKIQHGLAEDPYNWIQKITL